MKMRIKDWGHVFLLLGIPLWLIWSGSLAWAVNPLKLTMPGKVAQGHARYEDDCDQCHKAWRGVDMDRCLKCHEPLAKAILAKVGLHRGPVDRIDGEPVYEWQGLGADQTEIPRRGTCMTCHPDHRGREFQMVQLRYFDPKQFEHSVTGFVLDGKHVDLDCKKCHELEGDQHTYLGLKSDCFSCHEADDTERGHQGALGQACAACHTTTAFAPSLFDRERHAQTDYPLIGKHLEAECNGCHKDIRFKGTAQDCFTCHKTDDPHHGQLGSECDSCHTPQAWNPSSFDQKRHATTRFPLHGQHTNVACAKCHVEGRYKDLGTTCIACHETTDREKGHQGQLGQQCESCHSVQGWNQTGFNIERHNQLNFRLEGKHTDVECAQCHMNRQYKGLGTTCIACHTTTDREKGHQGQLGQQCESCHSVQGWPQTSFNVERHNQLNFRLEGKHVEVECAKCHVNRQYKRLGTTCIACHTTTDREKGHQGQLGQECESCHSVQGWRLSEFSREDHRRLDFKLEGKHAEVECAQCHVNRQYKGLGTTCIACHETTEREKGHQGQLGQECQNCHSVQGWPQTSFNVERHNQLNFRLEGKHTDVECAKCHVDRQYKGIGTKCVDCHGS